MDYSRPTLADRLAAEYVLGTLRGPARRRLESLLPAHPALRDAVAGWQLRLSRLSSSEPGVEPSAKTWQGIEQRLFGAPVKPLPWWRRLAVWQGFSGLALAAMVGLAVLLVQPRPAEPPLVIVLQAQPAAAGLPAAFVASMSADGGALVVRPLQPLSVDAERALELWSVPAQGAPRSLGLVRSDGTTTLLRQHLLEGAAALAVSLEPAGGSPTGAPTGPIVSMGSI